MSSGRIGERPSTECEVWDAKEPGGSLLSVAGDVLGAQRIKPLKEPHGCLLDVLGIRMTHRVWDPTWPECWTQTIRRYGGVCRMAKGRLDAGGGG